MRNLIALSLTVVTFSLFTQGLQRSEKSVKKELDKCTSKQFQCNDGSCIKLKNKCDDDLDCPDGSDEIDRICEPPTTTTAEPTATCTSNQFHCADGSCVKLKFKCDGEPDCDDGSDESSQTCAPPTTTTTARICTANQYQCGDGSCIKLKFKCDGEADCDDGSDESSDICEQPQANEEACKEEEAQCSDGSCINQSLVCDGEADCAGGEDEEPEFCQADAADECTEDDYQCGDNACISSSFVCDGQDDCSDGSDELEEQCQSVDRSMTELDAALPQAPAIPLPPPRSYQDEKIIDDILNLLAQGDTHITLDPKYTDLILVAGNTGAGKTTITKFITTDSSQLESYKSGHRYLIRDAGGQISVHSTIVSKTIFPELMIDSQTSAAFYDLPGFSDTRSPAIEIANAYFMKKVANHALRVKIIFIVNHSSLKPSESRTDMKMLLDHATDFIKNPSKFRSGLALVASKVEVMDKDPVLYEHMAEFLQQAKKDLPLIFQDREKQDACSDLLDIFLTKQQRSYARLAAFRQPRKPGRLDTLAGVQYTKAHMRKVVLQNTHFVSCEPDDFGISISPSAKLFAVHLEDKLNMKLTTIMIEFGNQLLQYFSELFKHIADPYGFLPQIHSFYSDFKNQVNFLKEASTKEEFIQRLAIFNGTFPDERLEVVLDSITDIAERLKVLHQLISSSPMKFKKSELIYPLEKVEEYLETNVYTVAITVNHRLQSLTEALILEVQAGYGDIVTSLKELSMEELFEGDNKVFIQVVLGDEGILQQLVEGQEKIESVDQYFNVTLSTIASLGYVQVAPPENFAPFEKIPLDSYDIDFGLKPSPINLGKCKLLVQRLYGFLAGLVTSLKEHVETLKEQRELGELEQMLNATHLEITANGTKIEANLKRLERLLLDTQENYPKSIENEKALAVETAAVFP